MPIETLALAMTGASGAAYGLRLLELLLKNGVNVQLMISTAGQIVINQETDLALPSIPEKQKDVLLRKYPVDSKQLQVFGRDQWFSPPASGTSIADAMVVCPCTVGMVSAIACGASNNLMERAADVIIKEQKKLILVVRETPFSAIHLENMLKLARIGVSILPASPGFYYNAAGISDLVDFVVARILDQLNIQHTLIPAWGQGKL